MQRRLEPPQQFTAARHTPTYLHRTGQRFMERKTKVYYVERLRSIELQNIPCMMLVWMKVLTELINTREVQKDGDYILLEFIFM